MNDTSDEVIGYTYADKAIPETHFCMEHKPDLLDHAIAHVTKKDASGEEFCEVCLEKWLRETPIQQRRLGLADWCYLLNEEEQATTVQCPTVTNEELAQQAWARLNEGSV